MSFGRYQEGHLERCRSKTRDTKSSSDRVRAVHTAWEDHNRKVEARTGRKRTRRGREREEQKDRGNEEAHRRHSSLNCGDSKKDGGEHRGTRRNTNGSRKNGGEDSGTRRTTDEAMNDGCEDPCEPTGVMTTLRDIAVPRGRNMVPGTRETTSTTGL